MKAMWKALRSEERGFTLLEVMVALAIISTSLVVLLQSQNANIVRSYYAGSLSTAAFLAQRIVSESGLEPLLPGKWEGEERSGNRVFSWTKVVEPSLVEGLVRLSVTVSWGNDGVYMLETYRIT